MANLSIIIISNIISQGRRNKGWGGECPPLPPPQWFFHSQSCPFWLYKSGQVFTEWIHRSYRCDVALLNSFFIVCFMTSYLLFVLYHRLLQAYQFLINPLNSITTNILNVCKLTLYSLRSREIVEDIWSYDATTFEKSYENSTCQKMPRKERNQQNHQKALNEDVSKCRKLSDFFSQKR